MLPRAVLTAPCLGLPLLARLALLVGQLARLISLPRGKKKELCFGLFEVLLLFYLFFLK